MAQRLIEQNKLDCHDCKYSQKREYGYVCMREELVQGDPRFCVELNSGDCSLYNRKWWKIWRPSGIERKI